MEWDEFETSSSYLGSSDEVFVESRSVGGMSSSRNEEAIMNSKKSDKIIR